MNGDRRETAGDGARIVIAGAGIAGLVSALALARAGIRSRIIEARGAVPRDGAGIQLGPNATRLLKGLGLGQALGAVATTPEEICVYAAIGGGLVAQLPLGEWIAQRHGAPYWVLHRADLIEVLWEAAEREPLIDFTQGAALGDIPIRQNQDFIKVAAVDGREVSADILVGGDGLWSTVRRFVDPHADITFTGLIAARTLIEPDALPLRINAAKTGVWIAPGVHAVHYPVCRGEKVAVVAIARGPTPRSDMEGRRSWSGAIDKPSIETRFAGLHQDLRRILDAGESWRQWPLFRPSAGWVWRRGRAVLIGDAAHPIQPFLAQGGAMAIEDGVQLAGELASLGGDTDAVAVGRHLSRFVADRRRRVERVQAASAANGRLYHLKGTASFIRNAGLATLPGTKIMAAYDWIYGADVLSD